MNSDEQAIRNLIARWHSATAADDVETVLSLMAEDAVFLVLGQPPMREQATFERGLRELLTKIKGKSKNFQNFKVLKGKWA